MSVEKASDTLVNWRKNDEYSIDGIIISQNDIFKRENSNPKHSVSIQNGFIGPIKRVCCNWSYVEY